MEDDRYSYNYDPLAQLLRVIFKDDIDSEKLKDLKVNKSNDLKESVLKKDDSKLDECENGFMNKAEFNKLISDLKHIVDNTNKLSNEYGIDFNENSIISDLHGIVYDLLEYAFNDVIAERIYDLIYDLNPNITSDKIWEMINQI